MGAARISRPSPEYQATPCTFLSGVSMTASMAARSAFAGASSLVEGPVIGSALESLNTIWSAYLSDTATSLSPRDAHSGTRRGCGRVARKRSCFLGRLDHARQGLSHRVVSENEHGSDDTGQAGGRPRPVDADQGFGHLGATVGSQWGADAGPRRHGRDLRRQPCRHLPPQLDPPDGPDLGCGDRRSVKAAAPRRGGCHL